jgi:hypothetical protein
MRNVVSWLLAFGLLGCRLDALTSEEARAALEESSVDAQAAALTSASIEVSTDFTIGEAVAQSAARVRDFVTSQLPCAEVTLADSTLTIEYGANEGACTFRGHQFAGSHTIHVERNESDDVVVSHEWNDFGNGKLQVSGDATVTWSLDDPSRRVQHELTWTRLSDGRTGTGTGVRVQKPLPGGLLEGIEVDGSRSWEGRRGLWQLDINHIEMRWTDPVPQAGSWVLETPNGKTITLEFERIDEDTIGVTAIGGRRQIELQVSKLGLVTRR